MNLSSMWKGIGLYQHEYKGKYPALANAVTLAQGPIDEEPEMVSISSREDRVKYIKGATAIKGNGSVNAYSLLIYKGYAYPDGFRCPSDESYECLDVEEESGEHEDDRPEVLGFNGWGNLSYALQPTSLDATTFSARPSNRSKGEMVIASDQVVDRDTPLTKTNNRPKENNTINHGYGYANVLLMDGSVRKESRQKGAASTVSKWGYEGDEVFTKTQSTDPVKQANDSVLMGRQGGKCPSLVSPATLARARELARREACAKNLAELGKAIKQYQSGYTEKYPALTVPESKPKATPTGAGNDRE